jgi:hypothetical protein
VSLYIAKLCKVAFIYCNNIGLFSRFVSHFDDGLFYLPTPINNYNYKQQLYCDDVPDVLAADDVPIDDSNFDVMEGLKLL